jgi:uncharacterized protein
MHKLLAIVNKTLFFVFVVVQIQAQNILKSNTSNSLFESIKSENFIDSNYIKKKEVRYIKTKSNKFYVKYNPFVLLAKAAMYVYQKKLSQQFAAECPYEYSCSNFSKECIQHLGFAKGILLSADRLTKCNDLTPFHINLKGKITDSPSFYKSLKK